MDQLPHTLLMLTLLGYVAGAMAGLVMAVPLERRGATLLTIGTWVPAGQTQRSIRSRIERVRRRAGARRATISWNPHAGGCWNCLLPWLEDPHRRLRRDGVRAWRAGARACSLAPDAPGAAAAGVRMVQGDGFVVKLFGLGIVGALVWALARHDKSAG